jgi:hypothetical protein
MESGGFCMVSCRWLVEGFSKKKVFCGVVEVSPIKAEFPTVYWKFL